MSIACHLQHSAGRMGTDLGGDGMSSRFDMWRLRGHGNIQVRICVEL